MYILSALLFASIFLSKTQGRFTEDERAEYFNAHHTWPPNWHYESLGYKRLMEQREREIMAIPGVGIHMCKYYVVSSDFVPTDERWENWMQFVAARLMPSFTERGYQLAQVPRDIFRKLQNKVKEGLRNWDNLRTENNIDVIYTAPGKPSKFIDIGSLAQEVHHEILPMHERWGGMQLVPTSMYGIRLYQNGSSLLMHVDRVSR